jgi:hypothetical protein
MPFLSIFYQWALILLVFGILKAGPLITVEKSVVLWSVILLTVYLAALMEYEGTTEMFF